MFTIFSTDTIYFTTEGTSKKWATFWVKDDFKYSRSHFKFWGREII